MRALNKNRVAVKFFSTGRTKAFYRAVIHAPGKIRLGSFLVR